jgi:hypothetical protein
MIKNQALYDKVKSYADQVYTKPSAYKSGFIVKTYKQLGGTYTDDKKEKPLARWFKEQWSDIGNKSYPVYRPTIKINKKTPLLKTEIDPVQLKKQIKLKQIIRGENNLPKFKKDDGQKLILHAVICHKPYFTNKQQALTEAHHMFPKEKAKTFVRETGSSFRVRIHPKTKFEKTSFVSKVINPSITLVFGTLKK